MWKVLIKYLMNWGGETSQEIHTINKALETNIVPVVTERRTSGEQAIREKAGTCLGFRITQTLITSKLLPAKYLPLSLER